LAIYGSLSDLPAPEILNLLASRTGVLRVEAAGPARWRRYELHLDRDYLTSLLVDDRALNDVMLVRDAFRTLVDLQEGAFTFENGSVPQAAAVMRLPVKQLVLSTATAIDELAQYRSRFPHPEIVFQLEEPVTEHLPGDLEMFYVRAEPHLLGGCSAAHLAEVMQLSVEEVQLQFYKLRSAGRLVPVRSYAREAREAARSGHGRRPPLLARLRESLVRLGRGQR
jgi:hypothetical protein